MVLGCKRRINIICVSLGAKKSTAYAIIYRGGSRTGRMTTATSELVRPPKSNVSVECVTRAQQMVGVRECNMCLDACRPFDARSSETME